MAAIAELAEDRVVEGVYAVARKERLRTRAGAPYLALELVDASGRIGVTKVPTTPRNLAEGVLAALDSAMQRHGIAHVDVGLLSHATTVVTNAILEEKGARAALVKGGHLAGPAIDVLFDGETFIELRAERVVTRHTHGTGCTFSAAIAARLALGESLASAAHAAKTYITRAISQAPALGRGHGPVQHFPDSSQA